MTEYRHCQPEIGSSIELEFQSNDFGSDLEPITDLSCGRNERQVADKHYNRMNFSSSNCFSSSKFQNEPVLLFLFLSLFIFTLSQNKTKMGLGCSCFHYHMVFRINFIRGLPDRLQYGERNIKWKDLWCSGPSS